MVNSKIINIALSAWLLPHSLLPPNIAFSLAHQVYPHWLSSVPWKLNAFPYRTINIRITTTTTITANILSCFHYVTSSALNALSVLYVWEVCYIAHSRNSFSPHSSTANSYHSLWSQIIWHFLKTVLSSPDLNLATVTVPWEIFLCRMYHSYDYIILWYYF